MYQHLFFDLDHTLWDFEKNSEATMFRIYEDFKLAELGIPNFESYFKKTSFKNHHLLSPQKSSKFLGSKAHNEARLRNPHSPPIIDLLRKLKF